MIDPPSSVMCRARNSFLIAVLALVGTACQGGDGNAGATAISQAGQTSRAMAAAADDPDPIARMFPGPVNLAQLERAAGNSKKMSPTRRCEGDTSHKHSTDCLLSIELLAAAKTVGEPSRIAAPVTLAIVRNEGTKNEYWLDLEAGATYLWVVLPGVRPRAYFVNAANPSDRRPRGGPLFLKYCLGDKHGGASHGWYCCNGKCAADTTAYPTNPTLRDEQQKDLPPFVEHTTSPWLSCALGCCYAEY